MNILGKVLEVPFVIVVILLVIAILVAPFYYLVKRYSALNRIPKNSLARSRFGKLDVLLSKYGTKYTDGYMSKMFGYDETKFEEIRQWTATYGDEEARRMYKEKYCNDNERENIATEDI